ncbi:MAG: T9SS C-terminal target domain-containing protein [Ignavibacteriales bacterium]|nr:MAG: T9SS C-terminal target domain-containing protein [Ignavibacteriales bacterium]
MITPDFIQVDENDNIFFAGNSNNIYKSSDNGISWNFLNAFWDIRALSISENNFIFAGVDDYPPIYVVRSSDSGNSWENITGIIHHPVWALESYLNNVYAGAEGRLYHSPDYGISWDTVSTFTSSWISTIFVNDSGYIFAGTWNDGVYISKDSSKSWQKIFNSTDYVATIQENSNGILYLLKGHYSPTGEVVFRSTDGGLNWELIDNGLSDIHSHSLLVSKDNSLYITTYEDGIFRSTNGGDSWFLIDNLTSVGKNEDGVIKEFYLFQNYPNPFNPSTKISWQSPVAGHQTLKVYDVLGNEVANLVNEYKPAGSYEVNFNASSLSSGIYFYRLNAGSFVQTKKMILIK